MFISRIIKALQGRGVDPVIVGGYAVALHGAVRGTVDLDIVITLSHEAFTETETAFRDLGLQSRLPVSAREVFVFREEYIHNRNLAAWSFINPDNPLEMVDIIITEDAEQIDTITKSAFGMHIRVASIPELIRMKQASGRPQDIADIEALEKLK